MNLYEQLSLLCGAAGVSGEEGDACEAAARLLRDYTDQITITPGHSVIAKVYDAGPDKPHVMLDAHIDEIGMVVTHIEDSGLIQVASVGGVDRRLLPAQEVTVHGKKPLSGVILVKSPHLLTEEERTKVPEMDEVVIDTGYTKEELEELVTPGDRITFRGKLTRLQGGHVTSRALDDRACMACILQALELTKGKALPCSLSVVFSAQEEVGGVGAITSTYDVHPDLAIAVDVSFALTPDADPRRCGKLGEGPMIGISPILDREIWTRLQALAKAENIPSQNEVMGGGHTGTNADGITLSRGGVRTGLISLPLRYMHTPAEVVRLSDMEAIGRLLAAWLCWEEK